MPAGTFALPAQHIVKASLHDVVGFALDAKVFAQRRAGPGAGAGLGHQCHLKSSEVTQPHKLRSLVNGFGNRFVVDARQYACQSIAAARYQRHVGAAGCGTGNGRQARGVIAGKALMAAQSCFVHLELMPHGFEARNATFETSLVTYGAGRGVNVDMFFHDDEYPTSSGLKKSG